MKFKDYEYKRPNIEALEQSVKNLLKEFNEKTSAGEQKEIIDHINKTLEEYISMASICNIRFTCDTRDDFYEDEKKFFNEVSPVISGLGMEIGETLLNSEHKEELKEDLGEHIFTMAKYDCLAFKPEILEELKEENALITEYNKLRTAMKIELDGEGYNLSEIIAFKNSPDREVRKRAWEAETRAFEANDKEFGEIFDKLVKLRVRIAKKLGYDSFTEVGYIRKKRFDYNPQDVQAFRDSVKKYIVPLASELYEEQAERIGVDNLLYYDEKYKFKSGNPMPKGDKDWMVDKAQKMYSELSPETKEFFDFMCERELFDLDARKGKSGGGYCTYIPKYKAPFIFSNFNGTAGDVDVLTHEAGHAFQGYTALREIDITDYRRATSETAEIHSMSMEFFAWPWMELFFKENEKKYKYMHLAEGMMFIPYGVSVDEFQHYVYANPDATPEERKLAWREIEKKYLPHRKYDDNEFLEKGGFWYRQLHIFNYPFYYIDYTLAQVCAMQFWKQSREDFSDAWGRYLKLCKMGGSKPFQQLISNVGIKTPFGEEGVKEVVEAAREYLSGVDATKL